MAGRKAKGGAKRGPKPKMTKEDGEALASALRKLTKLVRQIHVVVVPDSTEGAEETPETPPAADPAISLNGAAGESVRAEIPEAEVVETKVDTSTAQVAVKA